MTASDTTGADAQEGAEQYSEREYRPVAESADPERDVTALFDIRQLHLSEFGPHATPGQ